MKLTIALLVALAPVTGGASVAGSIEPAESLTRVRIALLAPADRVRWEEYLTRSEQQAKASRASLASERAGVQGTPAAPAFREKGETASAERGAAWYGASEARRLGENILSFQTPSGGWSGATGWIDSPRKLGQSYIGKALLGPDGLDMPGDVAGSTFGSIDQGATTTEISFLARLQDGLQGMDGDRYRESALRGIRFLLQSQFPNGGWPQLWPLQGGYHDAITYRNNAPSEAISTLIAAALGKKEFSFVPEDVRMAAAVAVRRAMDCVVASQVALNGVRTIWAQQYDALTMQPVSGKHFEPAGLAAPESADVLTFLMSLPHPAPEITRAVRDGVAWLSKQGSAERMGDVYPATVAQGNVVSMGSAGRYWAHFYSLKTQTPIFGDRAQNIYTTYDALLVDVNHPYVWYSAQPEATLVSYRQWQRRL